MIVINIFKQNQLTNSASFQTEAEADIWLNEQIKNKSFGEPETYQIKVEYV